MIATEFVQCVDSGQLHYKHGDQLRLFTENSKLIIAEVNVIVKEKYPIAWAALCRQYDKLPKSAYLKSRRFAKCNLSLFDSKMDIDANGVMTLEFVPCPLRGECFDEGIICCPTPNTALSKRQLEVAGLVDKGLSDIEIADILCISVLTVKTHIKNMLKITSTSNRRELARYCRTEKLI